MKADNTWLRHPGSPRTGNRGHPAVWSIHKVMHNMFTYDGLNTISSDDGFHVYMKLFSVEYRDDTGKIVDVPGEITRDRAFLSARFVPEWKDVPVSPEQELILNRMRAALEWYGKKVEITFKEFIETSEREKVPFGSDIRAFLADLDNPPPYRVFQLSPDGRNMSSDGCELRNNGRIFTPDGKELIRERPDAPSPPDSKKHGVFQTIANFFKSLFDEDSNRS